MTFFFFLMRVSHQTRKGPRATHTLWPSGQDRAVRTEREPTGRSIIVIVIEEERADNKQRETERETSRESEREKERRMRGERDEKRRERHEGETLRCARSTRFRVYVQKRSRVYFQSARVQCDTGVLKVHTGAFRTYTYKTRNTHTTHNTTTHTTTQQPRTHNHRKT